MFGQDLFELITFKTSCYRLEVKPSIQPLTKTEIRQVFGIHLFSSVVQLPNICQYWSDKLCIASIADTMTRYRFEEIMSFLHLCVIILCSLKKMKKTLRGCTKINLCLIFWKYTSWILLTINHG